MRRISSLLFVIAMLLAPRVVADFIRADANADGVVDISDPQRTLGYLFTGAAEPECLAAADANDDANVDISDAIYTLEYLFLGGPAPPRPFPNAGSDPTPGPGCGQGSIDGLVCAVEASVVELRWSASGVDEVIIERDGVALIRVAASPGRYRDTSVGPGDHDYRLRATDGSASASCSATGVRANEPPSLTIVSPRAGTVASTASMSTTLRVDDDSIISRIAISGEDLGLGAMSQLPATLSATVALPRAGDVGLLRIEAVDERGATAFRELPWGREPILRNGEMTQSLIVDIGGATGFSELGILVTPFLDELPALLSTGVRGVVLLQTTFLGATVRAVGNRAEVTGPLTFALEPASDRVTLRASIPMLRVIADGTTDFGFLGSDSWTATWTAHNVTIAGGVRFAVTGSQISAQSLGVTATIGSSDLVVSGFADSLGIFDSVVNALAGSFAGQIEDQVEAAIARVADEEVIPAIGDALNNLRFDLGLGDLDFETSPDDVIESLDGLRLVTDGRWAAPARSDAWPAYPGTPATRAPLPSFPITPPPPHPVDATISIAVDSLHQALGELAATGAFGTTLDTEGADLPFPLELGTLATLIDRRLRQLGIPDESAIDLAVELRAPPRLVLGAGRVAEPVVGAGAMWRVFEGRSEPPASWTSRGFADGAWSSIAAGFGYSDDPSELANVRTLFPAMSAGQFGSLFARRILMRSDVAGVSEFTLRVEYDDAFVAYLDGREIGRAGIGGAPARPPFDAFADSAGEPAVADIVVPSGDIGASGSAIAIQGHNASLASSDFILAPEIWTTTPPPPGTRERIPAQIELEHLEIAFVAGGGTTIFAYDFALALQVEIAIATNADGLPELAFILHGTDGPDSDQLPDAIVGGADGIEISVAYEAIDLDDRSLVEFARGLVALFGSALEGALAGLALPSVPIPELAFDLDGDGEPETRLRLGRTTLRAVDTNGDTVPDWVRLATDLAR